MATNSIKVESSQIVPWDTLSYEEQQYGKSLLFQQMGYDPTQVENAHEVHAAKESLIVISGGEGGGKSVTTSAEVAANFYNAKRVLFVVYKAESATNESDYLYEFLSKFHGVISYSKPKGGNIEITTRIGSVIESVTTWKDGARAVSGTGKNYDVICMLEAGKQRYEVFQSCLIRITRTKGLLILSGTIEKSEPWFPDVIRKLQEDEERRKAMNAKIVIMPTWGNRALYPEGINDPAIVALLNSPNMTQELIDERLGGKPSPPEGLVLRGFSFLTHVFDWVKFNPAYPVRLAIDPGYSGSYYSVNAIQELPRAITRTLMPSLPDVGVTDVLVIDDLYLHYTTHEEIIALAQEREWYRNVIDGVGDVIMKTHPQADRAPIDVWKEKGKVFLHAQPISIQDNVDRHRTFLWHTVKGVKTPRIFYNPACKGIVEYGLWKKKQLAEDLWGKPDEKYCDCMKAIGYYLIHRFGRVEREKVSTGETAGRRPQLSDSQKQLPVTVAAKQSVTITPARARVATPYVVIKRRT